MISNAEFNDLTRNIMAEFVDYLYWLEELGDLEPEGKLEQLDGLAGEIVNEAYDVRNAVVKLIQMQLEAKEFLSW